MPGHYNYPFVSMMSGETVFIPDGGDTFKLALALDKAKGAYKRLRGIDITYGAVSGGAEVTVVHNPNPQAKSNKSKGKAKTSGSAAGRKRGSTANVERAFWRTAFIRAFDVVPGNLHNGTTDAAFVARCASLADVSLVMYRAFVESHDETLKVPD